MIIDGRFQDWAAVRPEFRDTIGDPVRRNHPGYGSWLFPDTCTNAAGIFNQDDYPLSTGTKAESAQQPH